MDSATHEFQVQYKADEEMFCFSLLDDIATGDLLLM